MADLSELEYEHFEELVGETFRANLGEHGLIELELTAADEMSREGRPDRAFSLVFKGPLEPFLPQSIRHLEHEALGSLPIFLVPIGQKKDGFLYQAVFTRLIAADDDGDA